MTDGTYCSDTAVSTGHTTWSADVRLNRIASFNELKDKVRRAIVRARHLVPAIAYTISLLPTGEYQFQYTVPRSLEDALKWADEVSFFYEDVKTFREAHDKIDETRWWGASDHRYTHEVHVHPNAKSECSWTITLVLRPWLFPPSQTHLILQPECPPR